MTSNSAKPKTSRWGSLLSGAVAGLESRLDNIFAEEEERARQNRAVGASGGGGSGSGSGSGPTDGVPQDGAITGTTKIPTPTRTPSTVSNSKTNDRLQERLAKAVATNQKSSSRPSSELPSRTATPQPETGSPSVTEPRPSADSQSWTTPSSSHAHDTQSASVSAPLHPVSAHALESQSIPSTSTLLTSVLPINPARLSDAPIVPALIRPEQRHAHLADSESSSNHDQPPLLEIPAEKAKAEQNGQVDSVQDPAQHAQSDTERQEEMHLYLERIDALQAKLHYLARETVAAAREANATAQPGSLEQKIFDKDERIALLMEEGSKLAKTEMRHLTTIKKLRSKTTQEEKTASDLQKKVAKLEQAGDLLKLKLTQAEQAETLARDRAKRLHDLERHVESTRVELDSTKATVLVLRTHLADADKRADQAERFALENKTQADAKVLSDLRDQLEQYKVDKRLAEDRFAVELNHAINAVDRQREKSDAREVELSSEISSLETHIEALRSRAEEATSNHTGQTSAKLLRQIETLQTQYSLAAENWRTIETSLNSRIAAVEKERDDTAKREADVRKKARDASAKSRRAEEELDRVSEEYGNLSQQLQTQKIEIKGLQTRCDKAEKALGEAKSDFDRQRSALQSDFESKLEEAKSQQTRHGMNIDTDVSAMALSQATSPTSHFRKVINESSSPLSPRRTIQRGSSHDQSTLSTSRRPSALIAQPATGPRSSAYPELISPGMSRHSSAFSLSQLNGLAGGIPPTPSIHTTDVDLDDGFDFRTSPQQTINDVISATTVHTGPSVQLVERMSASIRRLESEKAAHKDELARLMSQRDESRNEVVTLTRQVESNHQTDGKTAKLETELGEIKKRYEACLEILGEREEEVEELKGDVVELKRIYRDLAERSMK